MRSAQWKEYKALEESADASVGEAAESLAGLDLVAAEGDAAGILYAVQAIVHALLAIDSRLEAQTYAQRAYLESIAENTAEK